MAEVRKLRSVAHAELAPLLTDEFLQVLFVAARVLGDESDRYEVMNFVQECYSAAGKPPPKYTEFEPFYDLYDEEDY